MNTLQRREAELSVRGRRSDPVVALILTELIISVELLF